MIVKMYCEGETSAFTGLREKNGCTYVERWTKRVLVGLTSDCSGSAGATTEIVHHGDNPDAKNKRKV